MIHFFRLKYWIKPRPKLKPRELILFFDGVCGLCNSVVDFVVEEDSELRFKFSALQSNFASKKLTLAQTQDLKSIVLIEDGQVFEKGAAVIRLGSHLGGIWRAGAILLSLIPSVLRDWGYSWVAKNRYRWFGKKETCRLPTPQERARFIVE